ncbi:hypothetical protein OOZ54_12805 [Rhodopseudomonas palustris]|uniref:hypothetical protein n=1 Tax=Rhodopseudomonas palustris TaxID=1076 RepID=UPI0022F0282A|nr:hypothetical protein [Rhodopseudomonas palustris]WBU27574.1 hypothetical protein OOZ54_12805 [Rhodopseudomonas palustris]
MTPLQSYHLAWLASHPEHSEEWLRAKLADGFHVHHIDFDHSNDCPENLVLVFGDDHLSKLHGWRFRRRPRALIASPAIQTEQTGGKRPAAKRQGLTRRAFANPPGFERDPSGFIEWQKLMGFSNKAAARALYVSANTIALFRTRGAPPRKLIEMRAIVAGIEPNTPWETAAMLGQISKVIKSRNKPIL